MSIWRTLAVLATFLVGVRTYAQGADAEPPVVGVHDIELAENVDPSEFDKFVKEKFASAWKEPRDGMRLVITKGDRGERKNKYQLVYVFDSVDTRDKHFPREGGGGSEVFAKAVGPLEEVMREFGNYLGESTSYTDYVPLVD